MGEIKLSERVVARVDADGALSLIRWVPTITRTFTLEAAEVKALLLALVNFGDEKKIGPLPLVPPPQFAGEKALFGFDKYEYQVVERNDMADFMAEVQRLRKQGWQFAGPLIVTSVGVSPEMGVFAGASVFWYHREMERGVPRI